MILLTPGPCMTSESVRQAGAMPDLNHRDPEYLNIVRETKRRLLDVYGPDNRLATDFEPYLIGGSGTAAMEAMVTSCVVKGPVLILANGYYSERMSDIFEVHGIPNEVLSFGWTQPWNMSFVEEKIASGGFEAVFGTHNETTTGRLNPVEQLGELCRQYACHCFVDAMSSFGADPIAFENLDGVCASANKCLHGLPGVSFVLLRRSLMPQVHSTKRRTFYLSLPLYEGDVPRLTPPVPALASFREALREMEPGLAEARGKRYARQRHIIRTELRRLGLEILVADEQSSVTLTVASLPAGWSYERWFEANKERGFILYGCKGELHDRYFQVSTMGEVTDSNVYAWLATLPDLINN